MKNFTRAKIRGLVLYVCLQRNFPSSLVFIALLAAGNVFPLHLASAAPNFLTAGEVMSLVNELRNSQGLQPYIVDAGVTAYAQEHSEYQARIGISTHLHSDGLTSLSRGCVENVAGGDNGYLTAYSVVYEIWSDPVHSNTMVGYATGSAGVGVASNATTTYVTLNVCPSGGSAIPTRPGGTPGSALGYTPIALVPLRIATMKPSGAVVHEVGYGQTLWAISQAYGVSESRLRELNNMAPDDTAIWAGQWLLIVPAGFVTPTSSTVEADPSATAALTASSQIPSSILNSPSPTMTPSPTKTDTATSTPIASSNSSQIKIDPILAGLIGLVVMGLILVFSSVFKINRCN